MDDSENMQSEVIVEEESKDDSFAALKMEDFNEEYFNAKSTAIFSTHEPKFIFNKLQDALSDLYDIEPKRDAKKWKMNFGLTQQQTDEEK